MNHTSERNLEEVVVGEQRDQNLQREWRSQIKYVLSESELICNQRLATMSGIVIETNSGPVYGQGYRRYVYNAC